MEGQGQKYGVCWHKSQKQRTRCGNEYCSSKFEKGVVQITTSHVNKSGKQTYLVLTRCNQYCLGSWKTKNKQKKYTKKKAKGL